MKMILLKVDYQKTKRLVGFAESIDKFIKINNQKTYPYKYPKENLIAREITPDVFASVEIEQKGLSNFEDYVR